MTGFEIKMDGVKYFVTAHLEDQKNDRKTLVLELYLGSMRSAHVYHEYIHDQSPEVYREFGTKQAKQFIKRALAKT